MLSGELASRGLKRGRLPGSLPAALQESRQNCGAGNGAQAMESIWVCFRPVGEVGLGRGGLPGFLDAFRHLESRQSCGVGNETQGMEQLPLLSVALLYVYVM